MNKTFFEEMVELIKTPQIDLLYEWLDKWLLANQSGCHLNSINYLEVIVKQFTELPPSFSQAISEVLVNYRKFQECQQALQQASLEFHKAEEDLQEQLTELQKTVTNLATNSCEPFCEPKSETESSESLINSELPPLNINCLGGFQLQRQGQIMPLCSNRKGQAMLRYLVSQQQYRASLDELIEALWSDETEEIGRQKLHIAASALRNSLNEGLNCKTGAGYLLCRNHQYLINPAAEIQTDVDLFLTSYRMGKQSEAETRANHYEKACQLYSGPFMLEDLYADWSALRREQLNQIYLEMSLSLAEFYLQTGRYSEAIHYANLILKENRYDEAAYQQIIRAYGLAGRRSEGLYQYHRCQSVLKEELGLAPLPETTRLYEALLQNQDLLRSFQPDLNCNYLSKFDS